MKSLLLALMIVLPSAAVAQFVPTLDGKPRACPNRPAEPAWFNGNVRNAHKVILVQQMYRAQSLRAVVESGECSCDTRFPSWDGANAYFQANYSDLDRHDILDRTSEYRRTADEYRLDARDICRRQGNW